MQKIDYKKEMKHLYKPSKKQADQVEISAMNYLMIDGKGDPNTSQEFQDAIATLYPVAYAIKFYFKKNKDIDYGVMPLEGLWWAEDMSNFSTDNKDDWLWTLMIMQPEIVTEDIYNLCLDEVKTKKDLPFIDKIRFESYEEGLSAQIMHVGPFSEEGPTIRKVHDFIEQNGYKLAGKHHEIYLKDMRKTAPEKLLTVIRQPMRKA